MDLRNKKSKSSLAHGLNHNGHRLYIASDWAAVYAGNQLNMTRTAKALDISRLTLVNYLKKDDELRDAFKGVDAGEVDAVKAQLVKLCNEGHFHAIRYFLENRGHALGFCDTPY
ncbi:hypothetical protein BMETH_1214_0 [methanotrophic bacterial endosymbiont of Bathymodiolus sp.]|nr:hypothetical protein BMETH_1214_0 [methanotrophic bacterial endosymbiont of Bathymodiolus sp.]